METIYIVSGLPRSGTSMMMKMLQEGGMDLFYDEATAPNILNPNGFYQTKLVNTLSEDTSWLSGVVNKFVKITSRGLYLLPDTYNYKIIYMRREINEIVASTRNLLEYTNNPDATEAEGYFLYTIKQEIEKAKDMMDTKSNMEYIYIYYNNIIADADTELGYITNFLNINLDIEKMKAVLNLNLYRNRV